MPLKIEQVKTFKIAEIPDTPGVFYFDFINKNNDLTRIVVEVDPNAYDPDKVVHIGVDWSNLLKKKPGLDLADAFKKIRYPYDRYPPGKSL